MRVRRENGRISSLVWGETLEIYLSFDRLKFEYCTSFYFDQRHMLNTSVTTLIAIIGFCFTGFHELSLIWLPFLILPFGKIFLHFPWKSKRPEDCDWPVYGFYLSHSDAPWYKFNHIVLCWGMKNPHIYMPWSWQWYRRSVLKIGGGWEHETNGNKKNFYKDQWKTIIKYESFPYEYTLKNHRVQEVIATCYTEEMEWRMKWFMWSSFPKRVRRYIQIEFSGEVGERAGEWKGGTIGCSYLLRKGETVEQCLRRMEKERIFR